MLEDMALQAGPYPYDRRIWIKDAVGGNWAASSYRAADEFEYIYIFWKPGITKVDRSRLTKKEWAEWGSRAVWNVPPAQRKDSIELPRRIVKLLSEKGDLILDCFTGSGTTAIAALMEGRLYIGIGKEEKQVRLAQRSIKSYREEAVQMNLFHPESFH